MRAAAARNVLKAWLLVLGLAAAAAGVGWLVAGQRGFTLFAFCSLLASSAAYAVGDRALLGALGARPFALAEDPLLRSTVERLSAGLGIAPPKLHLIDDAVPRALVVGRGPRSASLAVGRSLTALLRPEELDALLAHELAHVRSRDVLTQTFAALIASTLLDLSRIGGRITAPLLPVVAPVAAAFVHLLLSPRRELDADALAAALTDPHDLADALTRLDRATELVAFGGSPATACLYAVSPFDETDRLTRMFATHPPIAQRLALLRRVPESATRDGASTRN